MPETTVPDEPGERECLRCYIRRMLRSGGCDNTKKWTIRWGDRRVPVGEGGERGERGERGEPGELFMSRLDERGGICCDCEVLLNVWEDADDARWPDRCAGADDTDPLVLCAGWAGSFPRDPQDPYDYDDDWEEGFTSV